MEQAIVERRAGSRTPLRVILIVMMALSAWWLYRLYEHPTWSKMGSFVLGYFLGSFVMDWINQRSSRGLIGQAGMRRAALRAQFPESRGGG